MISNLPLDNAARRDVFDKFFSSKVSFPAEEIDAVLSFFLKRGFELESARSISIIMLNQAREDQVNVFELLDSLKKLTDVQMNQLIAQVLNSYRENVSALGYRIQETSNFYESRNILI